MSGTVDKRIVDMQFNNRQFETGIKDSLSSLDKLKRGLNLDSAARGLSGLSEAGRKFSLAGIADGVDSIAGKFSALSIIGVTALANIANSAVNAGKQIVSALTVDPIKTGFAEYELKMGSIQTIMAGTGEDLETVNKYLAELNEYSDRTIYSFADMTSNIGKFTNSGVSLKDSVAAIQGVANVAAISGANAGEASRAMYNFSQALSSGYVQLIDWKSIELANMGTLEFKNQLIETGLEMGTLTKDAEGLIHVINETGGVAEEAFDGVKGFRDSLSGKWMTSDVLVKTLGKYTDETTELGKKAFASAQDIKTLSQMFDTLKESAGSGWAQSWELIFGDFEEGKTLFTTINAAIESVLGPIADARNEMLSFWKDNGGREALIQGVSNAFSAFGDILTPIKEAFHEFFPALTGEKLVEISKAFEKFTEKLKIGGELAGKIKRIFKGVFSVFDTIRYIFSEVAKVVFDKLAPAGSSLMDFAASIGDWLVELNKTIKDGELVPAIIEGISTAIEKFIEIIKKIGSGVSKGITAIIDFVKSFSTLDTSSMDDFFESLKTKLEPLKKVGEFFESIFRKISETFKKYVPPFLELAGKFARAFGVIKETFKTAFEQAGFKSITDVINGGILAAIVVGILKFIKSLSQLSDNAGGIFKSLSGVIDGAKGAFKGISAVLDGVKGALVGWQQELKAKALLNIAIALAVLAAALWVMSTIEPAKMTASLAAISVLFADLVASMALMQKSFGSAGIKGFFAVSTLMIAMSVAVLILAVAMERIAKIDPEGLAKGLIGINALIGSMVATTKMMSGGSGVAIKSAIGLIVFTVAILQLVKAVERLGAMDLGALAKGLVGVGVLIGELAIFMKVTNVNGFDAKSGIGMLLMAVAIRILASAVEKFGEIDIVTLIKGLAAMAIVFLELSIFTQSVRGVEGMVKIGGGLIFIGVAMLILAKAIEKMGNLSLEQIGKGLLTMGIALGEVALALKFIPADAAAKGFGLLVVATAILILAKAITSMGGMSWAEVAKGLVVLAGALGIIVLAMQFMTAALPGAAALLVVSIALTILGKAMKAIGKMSWEAIGKGFLVLAGAFAVLGIAALVLTPVIPAMLALAGALALLGVGVLAIGAGIFMLSAGLTALAVSGAAGAAALVTVGTTVVTLIPTLMMHLASGIIAFAGVLAVGMPVIVDAALKILIGILDVVILATPKLVEALMVIIRELLAALVEAIPLFVDSGLQLVIGILNGIAENISGIVQAGIDIVLGFLDGIAEKLPDVIDSAFNLIISWINGLADSIRDNHDALFDAVENLIDSIIDAITDFLPRLVGVGENIIGGLIEGIGNMGKACWDAAVGVAESAVNAVKNFLGIKSPSKVFGEIGKYSIQGLANGLTKFGGEAVDSAKEVGKKALNGLKTAMETAADVISGDMDYAPTIRPVLDLAGVSAGASSIGSMFNGQTVAVSAIAKDLQNGSPSQRTLQELRRLNERADEKEPIELDGLLTVQVVNDQGELIGTVQTAVKELLRKESR